MNILNIFKQKKSSLVVKENQIIFLMFITSILMLVFISLLFITI
jgi:hypothetical protein